MSGNNNEASFRTKVVRNNLHPIWEEAFTLNLPLPVDKEKSSIMDFPHFRIEIFDMNALGLGSFLGLMELTPIIYFGLVKEGVYGLSPSAIFDEKKNNLIVGALDHRSIGLLGYGALDHWSMI